MVAKVAETAQTPQTPAKEETKVGNGSLRKNRMIQRMVSNFFSGVSSQVTNITFIFMEKIAEAYYGVKTAVTNTTTTVYKKTASFLTTAKNSAGEKLANIANSILSRIPYFSLATS